MELDRQPETAATEGPADEPASDDIPAIHIGAHHGDAWAGLVLCPAPGRGFAFRFAVRRGARVLDLGDLYLRTHEVGPHAPDGGYARMSFDLGRGGRRSGVGPGESGCGDLEEPGMAGEGGAFGGPAEETDVGPLRDRPPDLILEWGRVGGDAVVGRVRLSGPGEILLRPYFPWDWEGDWRVDHDGCRGRTAGGGHHAAVRVVPRADALERPGQSGEEGPATVGPRFAELRFVAGTLSFAAALAPTGEGALEQAQRLLEDGPGTALEVASAAYESRRVRIDGPWRGLAEGITNTLHWMVLVQPETGRRYTPAGRSWVFPRAEERGGGRDHWTLFGWDGFFNSLELALEAPELALEALEAGLATAYGNGCIPNWRGRFGGTPDRSQPPLGSFAALKLYLRSGLREVLERTYPPLARGAAWWSGPEDGRARRAALVDGLFSWGSDRARVDPLAPPWERGASARQRAAWESGQDDLPTWEEGAVAPGTGVLDLVPVDLNCYRVLDEECLARMAAELGLEEAAGEHARRAEDLRARIDDLLWDPETSSYRDRLRDGSWARCRSASHLLPLVAGVPDEERATALAALLRDPERFGGRRVVPTVARNDPHFPQQQYWRGTIWPPVNYLIQQGLRRYGFDAAAGEVAARSAELFLTAWRTTGLARENFDARTGEGGGRRHQSWGPLLALLALEELVDVTPWEGLRVGGLRPPGPTRITNVLLRGRRHDVSLGPGGLELAVDGRPLLTTDRPAVLRDLELGEDRWSARVYCEGETELGFALPGESFSVEVDGIRSELEAPRIELAPGRHRVVARLR